MKKKDLICEWREYDKDDLTDTFCSHGRTASNGTEQVHAVRMAEPHRMKRNRSMSDPVPSSWHINAIPPQPEAPPAFQHPPYGLTHVLGTEWNAANPIQDLIGLLRHTAPAKVDAATKAGEKFTSNELTVETISAMPRRSYQKNLNPSKNNTMANPVLEKEGSASELYPKLDIADDLNYDEFAEEEAVSGGKVFFRTKKLSTFGQPDMQKIVQGDSTKPKRGSDKQRKLLMEEEVSNTDRHPILSKDTRHVVDQRENRKQSPFSVGKSRSWSTSPSPAYRRKSNTQPDRTRPRRRTPEKRKRSRSFVQRFRRRKDVHNEYQG